MKHRIAAGTLVVEQGRLLLVHHQKAGAYDFWVAPGGGVVADEELGAAAERETAEETGLIVKVGTLAYIEELVTVDSRQCKFWFLANAIGGSIIGDSAGNAAERIIDVKFMAPEEIASVTAYPPVVTREFWAHLREGIAAPRYLGVRMVQASEFAV